MADESVFMTRGFEVQLWRARSAVRQSITATVARVEFLCWRGGGDPFACAGDNAALRLKQVRSDQVRNGWIATA
ncbi:hypothetical protein [Nocardia fluminea]|uniref:hypothetical protein n=1 Tax=Nocardia fluminea TaxID=134984 RepID=UPI00342FDBAD